MSVKKKTLAEHKDYIEKMCRISFFFASRWMKEKLSEKSTGELLRDYTPIFFHALHYLDYETKWNNPDCQRIMDMANKYQDLAPLEFEKRMWNEIKCLALERAEKFYPESVGIKVPDDYNAGSLKYDPPKESLPPNYCNFHIANAVAPKSIFDDPEYLPRCFMELMDKSEKEYGYDILHTGTWLNDHPVWLKLFPKEWHDNLSSKTDNVSWHFGCWGQLVNSRGVFNDKAGLYVREHGVLKYKSRNSRCSFKAMKEHLKNIILKEKGEHYDEKQA